MQVEPRLAHERAPRAPPVPPAGASVPSRLQSFSLYLREREAQRHHPNLSIAVPVGRPQLVDWLFQTCAYLHFNSQMAFQILQLVDLYSTQLPVSSDDFGLLFLTCLFCVAKFDSSGMKVKDVQNLCNQRYQKDAILAMEGDVLQALDYKVDGPTVLDFLNVLWEASNFDPFRTGQPNNPVVDTSLMFVQVMALDPAFAVLPPSLVAAAAFFLARDFCHFSVLWVSPRRLTPRSPSSSAASASSARTSAPSRSTSCGRCSGASTRR